MNKTQTIKNLGFQNSNPLGYFSDIQLKSECSGYFRTGY